MHYENLINETMQMLKFVVVILFLVFIHGAFSSPPDDPIKCTSGNSDCTITNAYGAFPDRSTCRASQVPTSEQELVSMVASASKFNTKVKAATRYSHSVPKLACPGGQGGILISTNKLNRIVNTDVKGKRMTVESGVLLRDLISEAAKNELALPYTPYWWGITVGGLMATGAHGSSLWKKGSAIHGYVVSLRIATPATAEEGYAKVRSLSESDEELDAAKVSLGVLGIVSRLAPMFKRALTYVTKKDSDLGEEMARFGKEHEFGDITWYPSQRKALYRVDDRVSMELPGNGLFDFIPFRPTPAAALAAVRATEELQESTRDANGKCDVAKFFTGILKNSAYGLTNNEQSHSIIWDMPRKFRRWKDHRMPLGFYTRTSALPPTSLQYHLVQKLIELKPQALCGLEVNRGILMRYVKASSAYLGKAEDAIDFDITYFRSKDPLSPRLFEDIYEEIEQIGLFKYGGLPHWGKNRNLAFIEVIKKYPNAEKFLSVKSKYDPQGIFSSEWTDQVLGLKDGVTILKDGCALEGLCTCLEDRHCAPSKKYYCKPGKVYKEARVCGFDDKADLKEEL